MFRIGTLMAILAFLSYNSFSQAPSNDSCANAQILTPSATIEYDTFQISNATSDLTGCGVNDDVWFKFRMPLSGGIKIRTDNVDLAWNPYVRLYTGACGSLTTYACEGTCSYYSNNNCGDYILLKDSALFGDSVYLRVSMRFSGSGTNAALSIQSIPDNEFQTNDSCGAATDITANLTSSRDTFSLENTLTEISLTACGNDEDVWVKFEVPSSGGFTAQSYDFNGGFSQYFRAYTGSCASLSTYDCQGTCDYYSSTNCGSFLRVINPNLANDTVWLRISNRFSSDARDSFAIDITEISSADFVANDSCPAAIDITANLTADRDTFTLLNAMAENNLTACGNDEDIWVKFEVPSSGGFKAQTYDLNGGFDQYFRAYTGSCASLSIYDCQGTCNYYSSTNCGPFLRVIDPDLANDTIWLKIANRFSSDPRDSFAIDINEISSSDFAANDSCESAIDITANLTAGRDTFTLLNAMADNNLTACGDNEDIWLKMEVPSSGAFNLTTYDHNGGFNQYFRVYTGNCSSLDVLDCSSGNCNYYSTSNCGSYLRVSDTSLIGDTVYLKVANRFDSDARDSFSIDAVSISSADLHPNETCQKASLLTSNSDFELDTFSVEHAIVELSSNSCGDNEDIWFKYKVPSNGAFEIKTEKVTTTHDIYVQLFSGSCGSLVQYSCAENCNLYSASNTCTNRMLIRDSSLANDTVYFRMSQRFDGGPGTFSVGIRHFATEDLPSNDDCESAQFLQVSNGSCSPDTFDNLNTTYSEVPTGSCGGFVGSDVWFNFIMPSSDDVTATLSQLDQNASDFRITAFTGGCASLVEQSCASSGNYPDLNIRNQSLAGDTIWLHVYRTFINVSGDTFGLCVTDTVLPSLRTDTANFEKTSNCPIISGSSWFDLVDDSGKLIASINPNGNYLGSCCYGIELLDSSESIRVELDTNGNNLYVLPRNFYIDPSFDNSATIRLYFTEREVEQFRDSIDAKSFGVGPSLADFYQDSIKVSKVDGADLLRLSGANPTLLTPTASLFRDSIIIFEISVSSFSKFVPHFNPGNAAVPVVPVDWLSFTAEEANGRVELNWQTASELNNSHFVVERSR